MDESFDHLVRSVAQLERYRHYFAENPKRAGLPHDAYSLRQTEIAGQLGQTGLSALWSLDIFPGGD